MPESKIKKAEKSYKDLRFLNSPDARVIRILSEFVHPLAKLRKEGVKDTIVFFGSARILSGEGAAKEGEKRRTRKLTKGKDDRFLEMSRYYDECTELARKLTHWSKELSTPNHFVICSGGGPGIMEAANRGASEAGGKSIGLNISLPFEQFPNQFISPSLNFEFHYFFMRKFWFVYLAKAFVMFPGGFGTLDELMEVLTLLQTRKVKKPVVVLLYGKEFWRSIINFDEMVRRGVISEEDLNLFAYVDSPDEAYKVLTKRLRAIYPAETARDGT
jgi:hypothetical protein